jgi:hypothetical protein
MTSRFLSPSRFPLFRYLWCLRCLKDNKNKGLGLSDLPSDLRHLGGVA